ncbi:hypothetical protein IAT38_001447 [Cryptococcus sp. DSM 104549]
MSALSRSALSATRAASQRSLSSTSRLPTAITSGARGYASRTERREDEKKSEMIFGGPPPAKKDEGAIMKRYTGPGFPAIPGLRHLVYPYHAHLHKGQPLRELTTPLRRKGGRNNTGQIVNRHVGGGHKRRLRLVDFHRKIPGEHDVVRIEYDPGRSAHIALLKQRGVPTTLTEAEAAKSFEKEEGTAVKGGWSYIVAPQGLRAGDTVTSFRGGIPAKLLREVDLHNNAESADEAAAALSVLEEEDVVGGKPPMTNSVEMRRSLGNLRSVILKPGNVLPLFLVPPGVQVHNISLSVDGRMQLCRSAGTSAQVVSHQAADGRSIGGVEVLTMGGGFDAEGKRLPKAGYVLIKLQSGEVRKLDPGCVATVGAVSNQEHQLRQLGKAGRSRWLGIRPHVRGTAMNAVDHAHGGGRGKSKGNKHPRSIYGTLQHVRTRRPKSKKGNKEVVTERPRGRLSPAKH